MKSALAYTLAALIAVAAGAGGYVAGTRSHGMPAGTAAPAAAPSGGKIDPATGRKVLYWHDPMVPGQRFDKPGKSPFMDMELVPVYADDAPAGGVSVAPGVAQSLGLRTVAARKAGIGSQLEAVGVVAQDDRATEVVQARVTGYIERLHVRAVLDPVKKGQPLATVFSPDWAAALEEYLGVRRAGADPALVDAARARLRLLSIPDEVVARSEQAGRAQTRYTFSAPRAGVVSELGVRDGAMVAPGMTMFRITDLSSVWVVADIPESAAARLAPGSRAEVSSVALPGERFAGTLSAILPDVDPATRTLKARLEIRNPGLRLKPGMFVRVALEGPPAAPALVVPQEAVIATGRRNVVIVAKDGGRFAPVEVELGRTSGEDVEVRSGLAEGDRVVASGQFLLDSEASLRAGLARLENAPAAPAPAVHHGEGLVEAIDAKELTLSHGPIASLKWGAMTMPFGNPAGGLPPGLKVGDRVRFSFIEHDGEYRLQSVERVDAGNAAQKAVRP